MDDVDLEPGSTSKEVSECDNGMHQETAEANNEDHLNTDGTSSSEHAADAVAVEYPSVVRRTVILTGVALALFCLGFDMTILATAIPRITDEFSGIELIGWYSSSFFLAVACFQPVWGKVYQYFSLKYSFVIAVFIFEIGSLLSGVSPSSTVLITGRAITGVGGAGIATGGYAILTVIAKPELRPIFTGLVTTVYSVANCIGPLMGGAFAEHTTWRWCFYVNLPFGGTSGVIIFLHFKSPTRPKQLVSLKEKISHLDFVGVTLALAALICFSRALQVGGTNKSWNSSEVIGLLVGFAVLTLTFILSQKLLNNRAMMVRTIIKKRAIIIAMIWGFLLEGGFYTLLYVLPIYFQAVGDISPAQAGVHNIPLLLSCGLSSLAVGFLFSKFRRPVPLMIWASAGGCVGTGLIYLLGVGSPASQWIGYQVFAGLAYGTGLPLAIIVGQANVAAEDIPSATAMILFVLGVGGALALTSAQSILDNTLLTELPSLAPTVDPQAVLDAGATEIYSTFDVGAVPGIVLAYLKGLREVYIMIIAFTGIATFAAATNVCSRLNVKK